MLFSGKTRNRRNRKFPTNPIRAAKDLLSIGGIPVEAKTMVMARSSAPMIVIVAR